MFANLICHDSGCRSPFDTRIWTRCCTAGNHRAGGRTGFIFLAPNHALQLLVGDHVPICFFAIPTHFVIDCFQLIVAAYVTTVCWLVFHWSLLVVISCCMFALCRKAETETMRVLFLYNCFMCACFNREILPHSMVHHQ